MVGDGLCVLMVDDDTDFVKLTQLALTKEEQWKVEITHACTLQQAIIMLENEFNAIVLDLSLPDSDGLETFLQIRLHATHIPIVVLTENCDHWLAIKSVREGAQDYLLKSESSGGLLARALYFAVERHHTITTLQKLSLLDSLTNLYNRRGFTTFSEQQLNLSRRKQCDLFLLLADVDYLKMINDTYGHIYGDKALLRSAEVLKKTFRRSDIIGRLGGDEFAVLAINLAQQNFPSVLNRFENLLQQNNEIYLNEPYQLSISLGYAYIETSKQYQLEDWIRMADESMYASKRKKHTNNENYVYHKINF